MFFIRFSIQFSMLNFEFMLSMLLRFRHRFTKSGRHLKAFNRCSNSDSLCEFDSIYKHERFSRFNKSWRIIDLRQEKIIKFIRIIFSNVQPEIIKLFSIKSLQILSVKRGTFGFTIMHTFLFICLCPKTTFQLEISLRSKTFLRIFRQRFGSSSMHCNQIECKNYHINGTEYLREQNIYSHQETEQFVNIPSVGINRKYVASI